MPQSTNPFYKELPEVVVTAKKKYKPNLMDCLLLLLVVYFIFFGNMAKNVYKRSKNLRMKLKNR